MYIEISVTHRQKRRQPASAAKVLIIELTSLVRQITTREHVRMSTQI